MERTVPANNELGFEHGDLWHGNTLMDGTQLTPILDWNPSGIGSRALGSICCDAALFYGLSVTGQGKAWRLVGPLRRGSSPRQPADMGWVHPAMADQSRRDLTADRLPPWARSSFTIGMPTRRRGHKGIVRS